ncbi:MAG: gephyrin-like molybdotransferase Glp, partial [Actinomycetota bacterium]
RNSEVDRSESNAPGGITPGRLARIMTSMYGLKPGFEKLATLSEAFDVLDANRLILGAEPILLLDALHRVTAEDVVASINVPHFAKSSMDGYAVKAWDTLGASQDTPRSLMIVGSASAGGVSGQISQGECIEIGTGAPMPVGADAVVMVEYTEPMVPSGTAVKKPVVPGENVIPVATDVAVGDVVVHSETLLEPRHLGVLAAIGCKELSVKHRPRVALLSTGPEVVEAGHTIGPGTIFDVNSHTLGAALTLDGAEVIHLGIAPDKIDPLVSMIERGLEEADAVLLSGGSSLGEGDLVAEAFIRLGEVLVHGVAVKPGKPLVLARSLRGATVGKMMIGLPGYPTSALSDYYVFVQRFLHGALGIQPPRRGVVATLSRKHVSTPGRYEFLAVRVVGDEARPTTKGSSSITALSEADGFIEIDTNTEVVEKGARVSVQFF